MADFENGLPPVIHAEGSISDLSFVKEKYTASDYPQVSSLSFTKDGYEETAMPQVSSLSFTKEEHEEIGDIPSVSSLSYALEEAGSNMGMYL